MEIGNVTDPPPKFWEFTDPGPKKSGPTPPDVGAQLHRSLPLKFWGINNTRPKKSPDAPQTLGSRYMMAAIQEESRLSSLNYPDPITNTSEDRVVTVAPLTFSLWPPLPIDGDTDLCRKS
uniref:Prolactin receptor n=1 Tax=Romanomermis culicivorax TaxID=13658 RepID=A0A915KNN8_ROMCU